MSLVAPSTDASTESTEAEAPEPKAGGWVKHQTHHLKDAVSPNTSPYTSAGVVVGAPRQRLEQRKGKKTPTHLSLPGKGKDTVEKLTSYWESKYPASPPLTAEQLVGLLMVASILWEGRKENKKRKTRTMRLTRQQSLCFVRSLGMSFNSATFVCEAWGCELLVKGAAVNGKQTNLWAVPAWAEGQSHSLPVFLSPYQAKRWVNRKAIILCTTNRANPVLAKLRETLELTKEGKGFSEVADGLTKDGEISAVKSYRNRPGHANLTMDGDYGSFAARLPEILRKELTIDGQDVVELDIKSAHAVLLGMLYDGEVGPEWDAERSQFLAEARAGFVSIYGENKQHKVKFLSALNQRAVVSRNASHGYREFERMFPLLAEKSASVRWRDSKALGSLLRHKLATIMRDLILANHADGIRCIPVVDSAVVVVGKTHWEQHQSEFRTAWRLAMPIKTLTGASPLIEGSSDPLLYVSAPPGMLKGASPLIEGGNPVTYQFLVSEPPKPPAAPLTSKLPTRTGT